MGEPTQKGPYTKLPVPIREQLRASFPAEAISAVPGKEYLSSLKAIYVVERLNDVFGIGGWTVEHEIVEDLPDYVTVRGSIIVFDYNLRTPVQYGGHKKTGKGTEAADGYKSAVTDMQSKCASFLEIGLDVFKGKVKAPSQGGNGGAPRKQYDKSPPAAKEVQPPRPKTAKERFPKRDHTPLSTDNYNVFLSGLEELSGVEGLHEIWDNNPTYQTNHQFITMVEKRKLELLNLTKS